MKIEGPAKQVRIYIGDSDLWHGKPLYAAIVQRAHDLGLAGATVLHGLEGFGATTRIHTARILRLTQDLPIVIDIIDKEERITAFLPVLGEMVTEGLVTLQDIEVVRYVGNPTPPKGK
jgi:PII-like signaling protein